MNASNHAIADARNVESADLPSIAGVRIYLARHGETALNAAGVLRGRLDPELNTTGLREAEALGEVLAHEDVQLIVASPLRRAVATARAIATRAGLDVEPDPRFIDRDYGPWAGHSREEVNQQWGSIDNAPDVESVTQIRTRAMAALEQIAQRIDRGSAAVIVSHDAINQILLITIDPELDSGTPLPQETGCYNVLERDVQGWTVLSVDNVPGRMRH